MMVVGTQEVAMPEKLHHTPMGLTSERPNVTLPPFNRGDVMRRAHVVVIAASAQYIKPYAKSADMATISVDLIVRSAARIERLCNIHHGSTAFNRPKDLQ
jgi:hypothetical protein